MSKKTEMQIEANRPAVLAQRDLNAVAAGTDRSPADGKDLTADKSPRRPGVLIELIDL